MNHIIVHEVGTEWGPFVPVATSSGVTLDFATTPAESITLQHYAFLVSDAEFDSAFDPGGHGMEIITRPYGSHLR